MVAQFNFKISDELLERAKKVAEENGIPLGKMIKQLLLEATGGKKDKKSRIEILEERLTIVEKELEELKQKQRT